MSISFYKEDNLDEVLQHDFSGDELDMVAAEYELQ